MRKKKILIVEDDFDLVKALIKQLEANSYNTVHAADAVSAIRKAIRENPDLIVLDIGLPAGDGFIVMDRLKAIEQLSPVPIIMITGRDPRATYVRSLRVGVAAYLQKPLDNDQLLSVIEIVLEGSSSDPAVGEN